MGTQVHMHNTYTDISLRLYISLSPLFIRKWKLLMILFWATGLQGEEFVLFYIETQGAMKRMNMLVVVVVKR